MANICEKLIEQVSSDSAKLSPELQSHVLTCPECQQYLESIKSLKAARKGISAKEAAAIAGIVGLIGKEAAASASAATAGSGAAAGATVGLFAKAALVVLFVAVLTMAALNNSSSKVPLSPSNNIQSEDKAPLTENVAGEIQAENSVNEESGNVKASATASSTADQYEWQNSAEQDKIDATNSIIVSPDQEDIKTR